MIVEKLVPEVYYKESRDFAFIGRLFEIVFNYMKSGADCINVDYSFSESDNDIIELLSDTVGFTSRHRYNNKNLLSITGSFQKLLREKGSIYAVELAVKILMSAQKITGYSKLESSCIIDENDPFNLLIHIPDTLTDIVLLEDLFDYILPAGMTYTITKIKSSGIRESNIEVSTEFKVKTGIPDFTYGYINSINNPISDEDLISDDLSKRNSGYIGTINTGRVINDIDINSQEKTNT